METQSNGSTSYLNKKTGEVILVTDEELQATENKDPLDDYPKSPKSSMVITSMLVAAKPMRL
jgi:hypothetical protein